MSKIKYIIHPFLFGFYYVLFLYSQNLEVVSRYDFLAPLLITTVVILVLFTVLNLLIKNSDKTAIIISIAIMIFFTYGHIYDWILDFRIGSIEIGRHRYLLLLSILIMIMICYKTIRYLGNLEYLTKLLTIVSITLVMFPIYKIGVYQVGLYKSQKYSSDTISCLDHILSDENNKIPKRDIYYLILDGYPNNQTLDELFEFDNSNFIDFLKNNGFLIAKNSRSNYPMTFLSLASSLNLEYINYVQDHYAEGARDQGIPYKMIENNKVIHFLKMNDYNIINCSSGWWPTEINSYADSNVKYGKLEEFQRVLIQTTLLRIFEGPIAHDLREDRLYAFSSLQDIHRLKSPKYVFSHLVAPHPPYLFDREGKPVIGADLTLAGDLWRKKKDFIDQLIFTNEQVKNVITNILDNSEIEPIIIIQADHGTGSTIPLDMFWWEKGIGGGIPSEIMLKERFGILNAYYLPDGGGELLYESITPVNTFRVIFNHYFGTNCDLLEDKNYYSEYDLPYEFINVTELF